ncbi:SDR family NAD(P)-dependent oxidoreductase [Gordonia humi]|uniref:NAD(P)-dependent dehydrogenase (Short-subunit alcohol dehydrogenase family) n=1 Tax=Gordonia humi TaxID=686429 RepID=A0A840EVR2_9ACTN|nr:SDR family oxidoreductase [Gordonia humi]MBB4133926.1 NAD(P)-dependent dehydrogenase (short-subunit alcohol dehydrogenase family) [Gordonia humi]
MTSSTTVVTGAGRGIGLAIAHELCARGHRLVITDVDGESAERAAAEVGGGAVGLEQNVREIESHRRIAAEAERLGPLSGWVNNAGVLFAGDAWTQTDDELAAIIDINVRGVMAGSAAAVDAMGRRGGAILNIASLSALGPIPGLALYAASKAAVLSYTTSLQGDLKHAGLPIRARALCPDVVGTAMVTDREKDEGAALLFSGPKPLSPDDIARTGVDLMESRKQIFRVVPRWRGALVRSTDLAPSVGLSALALMRRLGDRRQSKS